MSQNSNNTITVLDYDPAWAEKFQQLKQTIWPKVSNHALSIEHVGSTSVTGLAAKPIIDLDIVIESSKQLGPILEALNTLGYQHRGNLGIEGREAFRNASPEFKHNLYVCLKGCTALQNHLILRDALRRSEELRHQYGELKKSLAKQHPNDIDAYVAGKTDFILKVLDNRGLTGDQLKSIEEPNKNPRRQ